MATYSDVLRKDDPLAAAGTAYNEAKARGDTAGMAAAHNQAETIRAQQGYSGGANGAQYIPLNNTPSMTGEDQTQLYSYGGLYNDAKARYSAAIKAGDSNAAQTAQADMYSAHAGAENVRGKYGFSGGANGSQYIRTNYIDKNGKSRSGVASMDYYNNILSKLDSMYQASLANNNATYAAQLQAAMANIERQRQSLNLSYDNSAKQLYIDRRMAEKNTPQALAAQGYNGGLTESSLLGIQSGYEKGLLDNEQNRTQGLSELEYQRINAQSENSAAQAQAAQNAQDNYYSNYANVMAQLAAQKNYEDEQQYQQEQDEYSRQQASQANYQDMLGYLKSAGLTPTADQLANAYGITLQQAQSLLKGGTTAKTKTASGGTAKYSATTNAPAAAYAAAKPTTLSNAAKTLKSQFSYSYLTNANKVAMIKEAYNKARITQAEANSLLDYIGA